MATPNRIFIQPSEFPQKWYSKPTDLSDVEYIKAEHYDTLAERVLQLAARLDVPGLAALARELKASRS